MIKVCNGKGTENKVHYWSQGILEEKLEKQKEFIT